MSNGEIILVFTFIFMVVLMLFQKNGLVFLIYFFCFYFTMKMYRTIYLKIYFKIKQVKVIHGVISRTFVEDKTLIFSGGFKREMWLKLLKLNCIEIIDSAGNTYLVYETYNITNEYCGKYAEGEMISLAIMRFDRYTFMEESLFKDYKK